MLRGLLAVLLREVEYQHLRALHNLLCVCVLYGMLSSYARRARPWDRITHSSFYFGMLCSHVATLAIYSLSTPGEAQQIVVTACPATLALAATKNCLDSVHTVMLSKASRACGPGAKQDKSLAGCGSCCY